MAFMFSRNFPFENGPCFVQASGNGSCHASAHAFAGPTGARCARGPSFPFRDAFQRDIVETPEAYLIYFDATGFQREEIHVKIEDKSLKISARKGDAVAVQKAFAIPDDVLVDDITAKFNAAELTVTLPRVPQEPKASFDVPIEVSAGPAPCPASPAQEPAPGPAEAAMDEEDHDQDADGSWVEVADADVKRAKDKGKASDDGHVLEDADS